MPDDNPSEIEKLRAQIAELQQRLAAKESVVQSGSGAAATTGGVAAGEQGIAVGRDVAGPIIVARDGATIVVGEQPITMTAVQRDSVLGRYLSTSLATTAICNCRHPLRRPAGQYRTRAHLRHT